MLETPKILLQVCPNLNYIIMIFIMILNYRYITMHSDKQITGMGN